MGGGSQVVLMTITSLNVASGVQVTEWRLEANLSPPDPQSRGRLTKLPVRKHVISVTLLYDTFAVKGLLSDPVQTTPLFG